MVDTVDTVDTEVTVDMVVKLPMSSLMSGPTLMDVDTVDTEVMVVKLLPSSTNFGTNPLNIVN